MTDLTPPPELVRQWLEDSPEDDEFGISEHIATQAARWGADQQLQLDAEQINQAWQNGADQELEACCEWLSTYGKTYEYGLRALRRPKPPSLKEQALTVLDDLQTIDAAHYNILRNALEQLND